MVIGKINEKNQFVIKWSIRNFFSLRCRNYEYLSPTFSFANISWHLGIYPNGQRNINGYILVSLNQKPPSSAINVEYSLGVKTVDGDIDYEHHLEYIFEDYDNNSSLLLLSRNELYERRLDLLPFGTLTLVCRIKHTYFNFELGGAVTANCSYCKEVVDFGNFPLHEKKCIERPIKCPECCDVIALKNWYEHECPATRVEGVCSSSSSYVDHYKNKTHRDFKELFLRKEHCDVVFKVSDREIPAHKAILSLRSPVFASTFRHDMKEKVTGVVDIEDFDPCTFSDFLYFLYCEDIESLSEKNVFGLFTAADKYDIPDLRKKCMELIKAKLSIDTFCDAITLALRHTESELIKLSTDFFIKNAEEIIKTVQWQYFLEENPTYSNELFIKLLAHNKNSKK